MTPASRLRDHPTVRGWHEFVRAVYAAGYLTVASISGVMCVSLLVAANYAAADELRRAGLSPAQWIGLDGVDTSLPAGLLVRLREWNDSTGWLTGAVLVIAASVMGAWIQAVLGHVPPARRWRVAVGGIVVAALVPMTLLLMGIDEFLPGIRTRFLDPREVSPTGVDVWGRVGEYLSVAFAALLAGVATMLGAFAGDLVTWTHDFASGRVWRWKLRQARRRRNR